MPDPTDTPPQPRKLLDDLMSMSVADIDRERLVNAYLDALIRAVGAPDKKDRSAEEARSGPVRTATQ